jgi:hypothetical protein
VKDARSGIDDDELFAPSEDSNDLNAPPKAPACENAFFWVPRQYYDAYVDLH